MAGQPPPTDRPLYVIRDWDKHFEINRTRELKRMYWVPLPNRMDGDGYTQLLDHPQGAAHFGAWVAIVEIASRCDPRGTLLRDGAGPHDAASLSRLSRIPPDIFDAVLSRLVSIGWLECKSTPYQALTTIPHDGAVSPHDGAVIPHDPAHYRTIEDTIEQNIQIPLVRSANGDGDSVDPIPHVPCAIDGFNSFWAAYPKCNRKIGKSKCLKLWVRMKHERRAGKILAALERSKGSNDWAKENGAYIPMPESWLNKTPWETDDADFVETRAENTGEEYRPQRPMTAEDMQAYFGDEYNPEIHKV